MKALVAGLGGIGRNVYVPQLLRLGFEIDTVDIDPTSNATYPTVNAVPKTNTYDVAVICLPNIHHLNAVLELADVCDTILVEKPGLANLRAWQNTINRFPKHHIVMVKNNLYRQNIMDLRTRCQIKKVERVEINWLNRDRIPNPGSWFTTQSTAFGGVTHDLFPHLYCYMLVLFRLPAIESLIPKTFTMQRWNLETIGSSTDYGAVNLNGTYDVCDYAEAHYMVPRKDDLPIPVTLKASWKEGYDDQSVKIYYKDGSVYQWNFGLCPDEVYGDMLRRVCDKADRCSPCEAAKDLWIHKQLETFQ